MASTLTKTQRLKNLNDLLSQFSNKVKQNNIKLPKLVKVVEVGPRDGLQNEATLLPAMDKIDLINRLSDCGLRTVETTSFVSPKWVPQMGDNMEVFAGIKKYPNVSYPCLVPNVKGLEQALKVGVKEIAVFGAASESFTQKNINCSIAESLERFRAVIDEAKKHNLLVRGYVSTVMGCPYQGDVDPEKVAEVSKILYDMGCYEISLGDTIGIGTPEKTDKMLAAVKKQVPVEKLAAHFHDTFDKAISNILVALEHGVSVVDSSIAGLGGCPYAKKQAGNVCTENVVYALHTLGIETGIDLLKLKQIGSDITTKLKRENMCLLE
ncbi:hypothetical protein ABPG72_015109 [Tetrahymena utriculariae]